MILDPPTRSRRRAFGRYLWPVVVLGVVLVAVVVAASGEETRSELEYLEQLRSQAQELATDGEILRDVASRIQRLERNELVTAGERISAHLADGLAFAEEEPPTSGLHAVRVLYRLALQTWQRGITGYVDALLSAADDPGSVGAVDVVAAALAELRAGDGFYRDLMNELERAETPEALAPFPPVVMMPGEADLFSLATVHVLWARSPANRLALRPDMRVSQIVSQPLWEVNPAGQAVVPATTSIRFWVVISNVGNVASEPETLVLTMTGGPEELREEAVVEPLEPDQQATIEFAGIEVAPGGVYQVVATLLLSTPDLNPENNRIVVQFSVNEE